MAYGSGRIESCVGNTRAFKIDAQKYKFFSLIDSSFKFGMFLSGMSFEAVFSFGPNSG